jgi:coenzyme PQQ synthesis protein D (PqqD)/IPT/TIG domain-containing protein
MYPRQSPTTHTEQLGDEASVYDWARLHVHALNPTAARVWRHCDGATSPDAIAAALREHMGIPEAAAVVELTLGQLARLHLLELPAESRGDRPATTRRWLLGRGVAAAMLPAIYSIVAPTPLEAQSPPSGAPTLTSVAPNQGIRGTTVAVTLTGSNFAVGGTTVSVSGGGVTVTNVTVSGGTPLAAAARRGRSLTAAVSTGTSLTASFVIDPAAAEGPRSVTVTTAAGTSVAQTFTVTVPLPPGTPTLASVSPNQGIRGTTVAVTLTGTNFVAGATTVAVGGTGATVTNVIVGSGTSLTANVVLDPAAAEGPRTVTVTTASGTSGPRIFTIGLPPPGAPTLTGVTPNEGIRGTTVAVTLTGTNFVVGATTVAVAGGGVTVNTVVVGTSTSLTANFVLDPAAVAGPRVVTVTTAGGTSTPQAFTISLPPPTLTSVSPNQGIRGETVMVTLTGTNFVVGATTVAVAGGGVSVANVAVSSSTSLTVSFVVDVAATAGARTVTLTTAGGTSGAQTFTVTLPPPGSQVFSFTGGSNTFTVPAGVISILIEAVGARGGGGLSSGDPGNGGRTVARVSVLPGTVLTVRVGGPGAPGLPGSTAVGGFNGGGASSGDGGGGGGGSSFTAPGATEVLHQQGSGFGNSVIISWL